MESGNFQIWATVWWQPGYRVKREVSPQQGLGYGVWRWEYIGLILILSLDMGFMFDFFHQQMR